MKDNFLKKLEKKLSVLSKDEISDIINEYSDIIDEKVKHGKTQEEAIKEFGDINDLTNEILKTYKINPDYNKKDDDIVNDFENVIKKGAQKLTEVTENIVDSFKETGKNFDTTTVFEILIKVFLVLLFLAFLKIPFYILEDIGSAIFDIGPSRISNILIVLWKIIIFVTYLIMCVLIIMSVVNKYTQKSNYVKKENKVVKQKENNKEIIKDNTKKTVKKEDTFGNFLLILVKVWCIIIFVLPLCGILIGIIFALCICTYLLIKGIQIYGIVILLLGGFGLLLAFLNIILKLLFDNKKIHAYPIFISLIVIVIGSLFTFDYITNLDYIDGLPNKYELQHKVYNIKINGNKYTHLTNYIEKRIDNTLNDNELRMEITYYDNFVNINEPVIINNDNETDTITTIYHQKNNNFKLKDIKNELINNLKDNKVYNYNTLDNFKIIVYSNNNTFNKYE